MTAVLPGPSRQSHSAERTTARTMARRHFAGATQAGLTVADDVGLPRDVSSRDGVRETFAAGLPASVEIALAPAREGYGGCAGANDGPTDQRIGVSREGTKQPCRPGCHSHSARHGHAPEPAPA